MRSDGSCKSRKPYKITKPRERWSEDEHEKFLEAIDRFGRNWKEIVTFVGTRSVSQVRSHAQKHFIRLEKKGLGSVVPPARRKARWGDKLAPESSDGSADSDQELSVITRQAGSCSSMSTFDRHHVGTTAGSSARCTEGSGCNAEYHDCQPLSSCQESFGSLPSQGSSFTSPPTHSIISYAQEFLRRCNSNGVNTPAVELPSCTSVQGLPAKSRGLTLDMLQQMATPHHTAGCTAPGTGGNVQSAAAVVLQQQQLQQLLCQQQARCQAASVSSKQSSSSDAQPVFGSWLWQRAAATATGFSSCASAPHRELSSLSLPSDQQSCPQLDGAFLAEVVKSSSASPSLPGLARHLLPSRHSFSASSTPMPVGRRTAFDMSLKGHQEPSTGFATSGISFPSPTTSFQSLPSNSSALTVKPEAELPVDLCAADTHFDPPIGLDDEEFWADFNLEDPLMEAVEAAMG